MLLAPVSTRAALVRANLAGLTIKAGSLAAGLAIGIALARLLGPSGYGVYAAAFALVSLAGVPMQLGLPTLVLRNLTLYVHNGNWGLARGILSWAYRVILLLSLAAVAIALLAAIFADHVGIAWTRTMTWAACLVPLVAWNRVRESALLGLKRIAWAQVPDQLLTPLAYLACLAGLAAIMPGSVQPQNAMAAYVLCALAAFVFGTLLLAHFAPPELRRATPEFHTAAWLRSVLPLSLVSGFGIVNGQIDLLILSGLSNAANAGLYRVAFTTAAMTSIVGATVGNLMSSHYAESFARADHVRLQRLVRYSAWAAFLPAVAVFVGLALFGTRLLSLAFGPKFAGAETAVILLSAGQTVNCAAGVVQTLLNMTGHARDTLKGVIAGALTNVVLNVLTVPHFGAVGAAAATSVGIVVENTICCVFAWRRVHINTTVLPLFARPA
jgi:O-antigen/teichoic acid export membrane protein